MNMGKKIEDNDYRKYRWFYTSSGKLVVGGKSDRQNELVLKNFLKDNYKALHTREPGSGFMIIQSSRPSKKDVLEAAIFCGCFSKQWKKLRRNGKISVDVFPGEGIYKNKLMKVGTFGVRGKRENILVDPKLVLVFQKGVLRGIPDSDKINKKDIIAEIKPGRMSKERVVEYVLDKIRDKKVSKDEISSAIPSGKMSVG